MPDALPNPSPISSGKWNRAGTGGGNPDGNAGAVAAVIFGAMLSCFLYWWMPRIVAGLTQAEPTYAGEVWHWVKGVTKESLVAQADAGSHPGASARFLAVCASLFVVYGVLLRVVKDRRSAALEWVIFASGAFYLAVLLCAPVMLSTDIYAYAIYGRVFSVYHASPYAEAAPIPHDDPFMPLFGIEYMASWYGPLWTLVSAVVTRIGGVHIGLTALLFRGLSATSVLCGAGLIWTSLRRIQPARAAQGLLLFFWNPLVLIESGLSGHNDAVMIGLVLLAVWLHLRGWKIVAVVALTLSVLVKFLTGPIAALYLLLVLREARSWRERWRFLIRGGLVAGGVAIAVAVGAGVRMGEDVPAAQSATSPDFYSNNFHELIFNRLRLAFGEDPDLVRQSIYFESWWVKTKRDTALKAAGTQDAESMAILTAGAPMLVIARPMSEWVFVYDPVGKRKGYVSDDSFDEGSPPDSLRADPAVQRMTTPPMERETVRRANRLIRGVAWSCFSLFGLLAAWRTVDLSSFLVWSAATMLAAYFLIITEIWPWYIIWSLGLGALQPASRAARFAILLSAGVLTLYATIGYQGSEPAWIFATRSLPAFIAPAVLWLLSLRAQCLVSRTP